MNRGFYFYLYIVVFTGLVCALLLSACQPTPEVPPMVNRGQGLSDEFVIPAMPAGELKQIDAPEHWKDDLKFTNGSIEYKVIADVDLNIPQVGNTPVLEMRQREFSDENLKNLVDYFSKGNKVYKIPALTKDTLQKELDRMKARKGNYLSPYLSMVGYEMATMELIEQAPLNEILEPIDIKFDYPYLTDSRYIFTRYDRDKDEIQSQNSFAAMIDSGGIKSEITATKYDTSVGSTSDFSYQRGIAVTEYGLNRLKDTHESYLIMKGTDAEKIIEINDVWLDELLAWTETLQTRFDEPEAFSYSGALDRAELFMADLNISEMGLTDTQKVIHIESDDYQLFQLDKMNTGVKNSSYKQGYMFTYYRLAGDLPSISYGNNTFPNAPTFYPECIEIVVTEDGIQAVDWYNMAQVVDTVAENTKLLPFENIQKSFLDFLNYCTVDCECVYEIQSVTFGATSVTAFNAPDRTWLIPAWCFRYTCKVTFDGKERGPMRQICMINALDGGYIPWSTDFTGHQFWSIS